jgi:hypothetical protein
VAPWRRGSRPIDIEKGRCTIGDLVARLIFAASALAAGLLMAASPAGAGVGPTATCAHGGNKSGTGCVNGRDGERYIGGFDDFRNISLTAAGASSGNPIHINQEMWFYTHSNESQFVEVGLRKGYWIPCSCVDYVRFWADFDSSGVEHRHTIGRPSADGSEHTYEVLRNASNLQNWNVYLDYNNVGTSTNQNSAYGYEVQHGIEMTEITSNTASGLANHSPLEYMNLNGAFVHDPYEKTWVDSKCSGTSMGNTCITGYGNGSDVWQAAKG